MGQASGLSIDRPEAGPPNSSVRRSKTAYAFETRSGFVEQPGLVFTDATGNMLRYEAGELVLELSDETMIERRFGRRRDAANLRLQQRQNRP